MTEAYTQLVEGLHAETSGPEVVMRKEEDGGPCTRSGGPMASTVDRVMPPPLTTDAVMKAALLAAIRRAAEKIYEDENFHGSLPPEEWAEYKESRIGSIECHVRRELGL